MKTRKFFFYLGIIVFMIAACGADNDEVWLMSCFIGLGMTFGSIMGCTKRELVTMFNFKKKIKNFINTED